MKEITQEEFEQYILEVINGEKSRVQITKELETDYRTLNKKIQLLSIDNPELYLRFIQKYPYKPREITTVPIRKAVYEFLTTGIDMEELAKKYQIGVRTLSRKINALGKSKNDEDVNLYHLCKELAYNKAHSKPNSPELLYAISKLEIEPEEKKQDDIEKRRQYLLSLEKQYQELCQTMSKTEAAQQMGYTTNRLYKLLNELYCIEIERNVKQKNKEFRERMAVNPNELNERTPEPTHKEQTELEKE